MADGAGAIPTIEVARVSRGADAILQQAARMRGDGADMLRLHQSIMELVEPELERTALARSTVASLRAANAELQSLVVMLASQPSAVDYLRDLPTVDAQALNVHMAGAIGRAGSLIRGIDDARAIACEWLASQIEADNFEPKKRLEDKRLAA